MKRPNVLYRMLVAIALAALLSACAAGPRPGAFESEAATDAARSRIKATVEDLYLKVREMKTIHRDLRAIAHAHAFLADERQLNYVQKASLHTEAVYRAAHHQWELFSMMEQIKPGAAMDYYTLRYESLQHATEEIRYGKLFIELYQSFATSVEATKEMDRALGVIDAIQGLCGKLADAVLPLVRKGPATSA